MNNYGTHQPVYSKQLNVRLQVLTNRVCNAGTQGRLAGLTAQNTFWSFLTFLTKWLYQF